MTLNYSFNSIEPCWFAGGLPFEDRPVAKVRVKLSGRSPSNFPAFLDIGELLCRTRHSGDESEVTLLLTYRHSTTPLRTSPPPVGEWYETLGQPVFGQIRISLTPEAVRQIRKVTADSHGYELTLENVDLVDVTKR